MDKEVIKLLEEADWDIITLKVTKHTVYKLKRINWKEQRLPLGLMPEDIVQEAIGSLFEGNRNWNRIKYPDLIEYLKSVIDSIVSHLYKSKEYKITQPFPTIEEGQEVEEFLDKADPSADHAIYLMPSSNNPEDALLEKEKMKRDETVVNAFFEAIQGDKDLEKIASLIMDGYIKPSVIAKQMGVEVREVYNLQKRFKRKCKEFKINSFKREEIL